MSEIYASLDIGSSTMKLFVGEVYNTNINTLHVESVVSHGIKRGYIVDQKAVISDINMLISRAENKLECKINSVLVNMPCVDVKVYDGFGEIDISGKVSRENVVRALRQSREVDISLDEEVVVVNPCNYYLDGQLCDGVPIGKYGDKLQVETMIVTTTKTVLYSYAHCIERAGLQIVDMNINMFSSAKEALDDVYTREGVILVDIGSTTTTVALFQNSKIVYLELIPLGGFNITKEIRLTLSISNVDAEKLKLKYGTIKKGEDYNDHVYVDDSGTEVVTHTYGDVVSIIEESLKSFFVIINENIQTATEGRPYEVVLIGGSAEIEGIDKIAKTVLNMPVRVYRPETIGARKCSLVGCIGLIYYFMDRVRILGSVAPSVSLRRSNTNQNSVIGKTKNHQPDYGKKGNTGMIGKVIGLLFAEEDEE